MAEGLDEIKGIGEKLKKELVSHFGSESQALKAIENQEYHRLLEAGIPIQRVTDIARHITAQRHGFSYAHIMKTQEAKELFNQIFELLKSYPKTDFARI